MGKKKRLLAMRSASYLTPEPEITQECVAGCCCGHAACAPLKGRALCRQWFFLRWVSSEPVMPSHMLHELGIRLGCRKFGFCAAKSGTGVFEVLLKVALDDDMPLWAAALVPRTLESSAWKNESKAWHLQCCWDAMQWDVSDWTNALREREGKLIFGDMSLRHQLELDVRAAGVVTQLPRTADGVVDLSRADIPCHIGR
ncbi:hypothetical protein Purlil1_13849 [Purpureocillium lilacinum]|uniref:Uncharacterized protein n=1 Tax=Purpureocillium lilacinum TaxID=33203 RepID=A0ABR0BCX5_PURLI|nr:hypothetical protein Purlil1_13849 [Purpureocillium lilacinum]